MELRIERIPTGEIIRVVSHGGERKTVSLLFIALFPSRSVSAR